MESQSKKLCLKTTEHISSHVFDAIFSSDVQIHALNKITLFSQFCLSDCYTLVLSPLKA